MPPTLNIKQIFDDKKVTAKQLEADRKKMLVTVKAQMEAEEGNLYRVKKKFSRVGGGHVIKSDAKNKKK